MLLLLVVFCLVHVSCSQSPTIDSCCATCLAQPNVGGADALDFTACSNAQTTCCFDKTCQPSSFGSPTLDLTSITFSGTDMLFPSGNWIRMQWPAASEVKYLPFKTGQLKTTQVTNSSIAATAKSGYFFICAALEGKLYFRGFANGGCTASKEVSITITPGNGSSCSDALPSAPVQNTNDCDPVRGAMKDGVCTCLEDFSGPPLCLDNSFWKRWGQIISYTAGGLSMITAIFGFYRFYKMRKAKVAESITTPAAANPSPKETKPVKLTTPAMDPPSSPLSTYLRTSGNASRVRLAGISKREEVRDSSISDDDIVLMDTQTFHQGTVAEERTSNEFTL